jgi:hypothetical protein
MADKDSRGALSLLTIALPNILSCTEPARTAGSTRAAEPADECVDEAALTARAGASCRLVGRYQIKRFPGKKASTLLAEWPVVVLPDGTEVMLESLWDRSRAPDPDAASRLQGRRVEVSGTVHFEPPTEPGRAANFRFWCLSPVTALRLLDP